MKIHSYGIKLRWTGNSGDGTKTYTSYGRNHEISAPGKPVLLASSDANFRGDATRYNPEELLVASLSACHMLWYLHLCATNHIVVLDYRDEARGEMDEGGPGPGRFISATLRPAVKIAAGGDPEKAISLHAEAHRLCFIANSVNFPVHCLPTVL
jgi:organic hydroperoxide reductase OsmC/OhrA